MKKVCFATFAVFAICCVHSQPGKVLTADQAKRAAIQLSNDKAFTVFNCRPFHDSQPAHFFAGHWVWTGLAGVASYDVEATVELSADGSTNQVHLKPIYTVQDLSAPLPAIRVGR